jgi:segregation and condensation protein A
VLAAAAEVVGSAAAGTPAGASERARAGEGACADATTPRLTLDGFDGPLAALLVLARAGRIDLRCLSLPALVEQLVGALQEHAAALLGERADWLVMAAWLVLLRTRLLLPREAGEHGAAERQAERLRDALLAAEGVQALAAWLARQPQLSRDVFVRGQPEVVGVARAAEHAVDAVAFLWAALDLFDDDLPPVDTAPAYRPPTLDLYPVGEARARVLHRLERARDALPLEQLLPDEELGPRTGGEAGAGAPVPAPAPPRDALRRRSAWSSTFAACLELARQGEVRLKQEGGTGFAAPILVSPAVTAPPSPPRTG